jgi:NADH-quinone oxidoreductase subunit A
MQPNLLPYLPVLLLLLVAAGLSLAMVAVTRVMGPRVSTAVKRSPFESGSEPIGNARERFSVKFYMVALLFIVFDVEAVFIYPWAVLLQDPAFGWAAMITMLIFMATLAVGLVYVWKKGALTWV